MKTLNEIEGSKPKSTFRAKSKKRVLVVDDDAVIRDILYEGLSKMGFEVATAAGGAEAFQRFCQTSFDLVVTDCRMPGTDGWQLAALIKGVSAHTPIIMLTGQSKDQLMDNMQGGDVDFLMFKPVELTRLYEAILDSFEISNPR